MADDRVALLHELLVAPLQTSMRELAIAAAELQGYTREIEYAYWSGAWAGYRLAYAIFEAWLGMTSNTCERQRFATHSNPTYGLPDGAMRVGDYRNDKSGLWYGEREDGGSCRG